ncbi:MAG: hypothetical protein ACI4NY_01515, partial [Acinetobacter amyesii]
MAVSEIAKSKTKQSSLVKAKHSDSVSENKKFPLSNLVQLMLATGLSLSAGLTWSAAGIDTGDNSSNQSSTAISAASCTQAKTTGSYSIALGCSAQATNGATAIGLNAQAINGAIAIGENAYAQSGMLNGVPQVSVAVGFESVAMGEDTVAFGTRAKATANYSTALGNYANASAQNAIAAGNAASASGIGASSFGNFANATGVNAVAIGSGGQPGTFEGAQALEDGATAIGGNATKAAIASGVNSTAISGQSVASGENALAIGNGAKAFAKDTISIGTGNTVSATGAVAVGSNNTTSGRDSVSIGNNTSSTGVDSVAIGKNSKANLDAAIAIGSDANAVAYSVALGDGAKATERGSVSIGQNANVSNQFSVGVGTEALSSGLNSVALGYKSKALASAATALGTDAVATQISSTAVGTSALADGVVSIALGGSATAQAYGAIAIGGYLTNASLANSVAIGTNSTTATNATTEETATLNGLTYGTFAGRVYDAGRQVSVGRAGLERQIKNVGSGKISATSTDAINGSQLYATNTVLGNVANSTQDILGGNTTLNADGSLAGPFVVDGKNYNTVADAIDQTTTHYYSVNDQYFGAQANYNNDGATGRDSLAAGVGASSTAENAVSVGVRSVASGEESIVIGYESEASGERSQAYGFQSIASGYSAIAMGQGAVASGVDGIAIGGISEASGYGSVALGNEAAARGRDATALGTVATADGKYSIAMGPWSNAAEENTIAAGLSSVASAAGAIALGADSIADKESSVALGVNSTTATNATTEASATLNNLTYGTFAGQVTDPGMQVSVGSVGAERQIKNVGSGAISATSTDAINGSQLYATNEVLGNVANSTKNILGGDATLSPNGTLTMTNIGNTGKNTIHDAIAASQEKVVAGTNIASVDKVTDAVTGQSTYTVNANGTTASAGSSAVTVVAGTPDANNVTDYVVDLSQDTKDSLVKADTALQSIETQIDGVTVKNVNKDDNKVNFVTGDNIVLEDDGTGAIKVSTAQDVTFNQVNTTNLYATGETKLGDNFTVTNAGDAYYTGPVTEGNHITNKTYVDQQTAA